MTDHHQPVSGTDRPRRFVLPLGPPMAVNIRDLPLEQIHALMDGMETLLGGLFFRDRELLLEVLQDQVAEAKNPRAFLYGPYLALVTTPAGIKRITTMGEIGRDSGMSVYAADQLIERFGYGDTKAADDTFAARPRPRC